MLCRDFGWCEQTFSALWAPCFFCCFLLCKKTGRTYHWAHFLTKRMGCSLKTIEKNAGKWQSNRFFTKWCFFGDQGRSCKQDSYSEKDRNQTSGQNIRSPYKMWVLQRASCCTKPSHFVWRNVYLHPFILQAFCKSPRFIVTRSGGWPLGEFQGGYLWYIIAPKWPIHARK